MSINTSQVDALLEMINIGVGRGSSILNTLLKQHITMSVPTIRIIRSGELPLLNAVKRNGTISGIKLAFSRDFHGNAQIVFPSSTIPVLISALIGEECESADIDSLRSATLSEVGNIVLNSVVGTISNLLQISLDYSLPAYFESRDTNLHFNEELRSDSILILADTNFSIEKLQIDGNIVLIFAVNSFERLLALLDNHLPG
ncbi:MAG: chemotaxis protein CheC [Candidatus Neomarinimicrobiota bacterium]